MSSAITVIFNFNPVAPSTVSLKVGALNDLKLNFVNPGDVYNAEDVEIGNLSKDTAVNAQAIFDSIYTGLNYTTSKPTSASFRITHPDSNHFHNDEILNNTFGAVSVVVEANLEDITPPSAPANLLSTAVGETTIDLAWDAATDDVLVSSYDVYMDGDLIGNTSILSYQATGLVQNTEYTFVIKAKDSSDNVSADSNSLAVSTAQAADVQAPSVPLNLVASSITHESIDLSWDASTDDFAVANYEIWKDAILLATIGNVLSYQAISLTPLTQYSFTVRAKDAAGNTSADSVAITPTTIEAPDVIAPTVPANLVVSEETLSSMKLSWDASTDDSGVNSYQIFKDGVLYTSTTLLNTVITGLIAGTTYSLTVLAIDNGPAFNFSAQSAPINGTTLSATAQTVDASMDINKGIYRSTRGDLDVKFRIANDTARNTLITLDLVEVGHIVYHETDGKHYSLKTYPTFKSLIGVVWETLETSTLQKSYDISANGKILTSASLIAFKLQQGSGSDTDNVFEVLNGVGTTKLGIRGNGSIVGATIDMAENIINNFSHSNLTNLGADDHPQYLLTDGSRNITGPIIFEDSVIIQGEALQVDSEITTTDSVLKMNDGELGAGVTLGFAGLEMDRGTLDNYWLGFDEVRNRFTVGTISALTALEIASTIILAGIEDVVTNNAIVYWDSGTNKLMDSDKTLSQLAYNDSNNNFSDLQTFQQGIKVDYNKTLWFGSGLRASHSGTQGDLINEIGSLGIANFSDGDNINFFTSVDSGGYYANIIMRGTESDVSLGYLGSQRLITTASGIDITGTLSVSGSSNFTGQSVFQEIVLKNATVDSFQLGMSGSNFYLAPVYNGVGQWTKEFGFNKATGKWNVETGFDIGDILTVTNGGSFGGNVSVVGDVSIYSGATAIGKLFNNAGALALQGDGTRDVSIGSGSFPSAIFVEGTNGNVSIGTTSSLGILRTYVTGQSNVHFDSFTDDSWVEIRAGLDGLGTEAAGVRFRDSATLKWSLYKETNNDFYFYNQAAGKFPIHLPTGGGLNLLADGGALTIGGDVSLPDSAKLLLGTGNDLQIYHDGTNSYINDIGTGNLIIKSDVLRLQSNGGKNFIVGVADAEVSLSYNNLTKLTTTNTGVDITGILAASKGINLTGVAGTSDSGIYFGDLDTRIYEIGDDNLGINLAGGLKWRFYGASNWFDGNINNGPRIMRETSTLTNPVYTSSLDADTGIGFDGADKFSLIAAGLNIVEVSATGIIVSGESSFSSAMKFKISRQTTTKIIDATSFQWNGNTDSGSFTYTLPPLIQDRQYKITNTGASGNSLTITPNGTDKLLGINSSFILQDGESLLIGGDTTDGWY